MAPKKDIPDSFLGFDLPENRSSGSRRWFVFNRSPLARKIILFNLIALGILVSGILYLNQSQDIQVAFRRDALAREAEMIAASINSHDGEPEYADLRGAPFRSFIGSLVAGSDSRIQIYNREKVKVFSFASERNFPFQRELAPTRFNEFVQKIWIALTFPAQGGPEEDNRKNLQRQLFDLASRAIDANTRLDNVDLSVGGALFIAVAMPLEGPDGVRGAIVVSTREGEVDSIIRSAREQILQVFLLATLSSIVLSMVLANSIARPLRRLSAAAQKTHDEAGGKLNLARVNIPDLSARPDEIGTLSRSMRNMTDALLERIDENKSFAADVSHEIKNPLTSLRSAVETLAYVQDDDSRKALLEVIQNDVERLDRLVTDISNASRLEGELLRDTWENVDLCTLLEALLDNFRQRGGAPGVEILFESRTDECTIRGLSGRLAQVFTNLVSNALSFVPGDGWVKVSISDSTDGSVLVEVSDNGPGIPEKNLADIFSRFYSERPEAQFGEHSGLGLAISKQIVEAHGGTIEAGNLEQGGALFSVKLPR